MTMRPHPIHRLAPLALGAALAGHAAADAKTADLGDARMTGPDPIAGATAEAAREMGKAYLAANKLPEALQAYRKALAQDPDSIESLNGIAVCFDRLGRFEDARTHYEAALGIDPTSPVLLNNYGLSLYLQGAHAEAARFLRLAASAGDSLVQAAALRTLAKIDQASNTRPQAAYAAVEPAPESGATIVRTSGHEQRLVLAPAKPKSGARFAAVEPVAGMAEIAAIGGLSEADDARIAAFDRADALSEAEAAARAEARREAARLMAEARTMVPADMQVAALLEAARKAAVANPRADAAPASPWDEPAGPAFQAPDPKDWHQDQILAIAPAPGGPSRRSVDRASLNMALLAAGFAPPRDARRKALAAAAQQALDEAGTRRQFEAPFASDNDRLNGFAARLHGRPDDQAEAQVELTVAEKVARLEALIERVRAA